MNLLDLVLVVAAVGIALAIWYADSFFAAQLSFAIAIGAILVGLTSYANLATSVESHQLLAFGSLIVLGCITAVVNRRILTNKLQLQE